MFRVASRVCPDHEFNLCYRRAMPGTSHTQASREQANDLMDQNSAAVAHNELYQSATGSLLSSLRGAVCLCRPYSYSVLPEDLKSSRPEDIALLVKQLFAKLAYNTNGDIVERSFGLIGQIKLTVCFDSVIQMAKYFSSLRKAKCLFARFCYTESIPIVGDDLQSRDFQARMILILKDFSAALSVSKLSKLEVHDNTKLEVHDNSYFKEVKRLSESFNYELKNRTEELLKEGTERSLLSDKVKALLLSFAKRSQQDSLEQLKLSIAANAEKTTSDNSYIYYVAIRHSKFFQETLTSKNGCGEGFLHVFAIEQYLDNDQKETFRLYNSYKGCYTLDSWLQNKRSLYPNKERLDQLFMFLEKLLRAENWTDELRKGWYDFFNVQVENFPLYNWRICGLEDIKGGLIEEEDITTSLQLQGLTFRYAYDNFKPSEVAVKLRKSTKPL